MAKEEDNQQEDTNVCKQCGGTLSITYMMGFEQGRPMYLRAEPPTMLKLCPGHPMHSLASQEEDLSHEQRYSLMELRQRMQGHFDAEISAFYAKYPLIRLDYDFTIDAIVDKDKDE